MMMLLLVLSPARSSQVHRSCGIQVAYKFVECSAVPQVKLSIDLRANIVGASYEANALQNNHPKTIARSALHF